MSIKVATIGGTRSDTEFDKRVVLRIIAIMDARGYSNVNIAKFKELITEHTQVNLATGHDVLVVFNDLPIKEKEAILDACCSKREESDKTCITDCIISSCNEIPDTVLKKRLKYCKNPLERKMLNRELSRRHKRIKL